MTIWETERPLTISELAKLVFVAAETPHAAVRDAALAVLEQGRAPALVLAPERAADVQSASRFS